MIDKIRQPNKPELEKVLRITSAQNIILNRFTGNRILNFSVKTNSLSPTDKDQVIETYRKSSEKEAIICPFCFEKLLLRAGEIRDVHFAHGRGQTCQMARSYDSYQTQVSRENEKHSVIKESIYTDLKGQERFNDRLAVRGIRRHRRAWRRCSGIARRCVRRRHAPVRHDPKICPGREDGIRHDQVHTLVSRRRSRLDEATRSCCGRRRITVTEEERNSPFGRPKGAIRRAALNALIFQPILSLSSR